jgi:hypothetical protein
MVLFLVVGAAAFAGERAYSHHKKSKAKKLAKAQLQTQQAQQSQDVTATMPATTRSTEIVDEDLYEDLPPYQKDVQGPVVQQGQVPMIVEPPMYSASQETIPIPERSPLREKGAM